MNQQQITEAVNRYILGEESIARAVAAKLPTFHIFTQMQELVALVERDGHLDEFETAYNNARRPNYNYSF